MKSPFILFCFLVSVQLNAQVGFNKAEYFFDTDPGAGLGTSITTPVGTNDTINFTSTIPTTSLAAGFHFLGLRVKHNDGRWGLFEKRGFYISNSTANSADINAAEYFFDNDPG